MLTKNPPKCPHATTKPLEVPPRYLKVPPDPGGNTTPTCDVSASRVTCDGAPNSAHHNNKPATSTAPGPSRIHPHQHRHTRTTQHWRTRATQHQHTRMTRHVAHGSDTACNSSMPPHAMMGERASCPGEDLWHHAQKHNTVPTAQACDQPPMVAIACTHGSSDGAPQQHTTTTIAVRRWAGCPGANPSIAHKHATPNRWTPACDGPQTATIAIATAYCHHDYKVLVLAGVDIRCSSYIDIRKKVKEKQTTTNTCP
jgi:hypothetical protein